MSNTPGMNDFVENEDARDIKVNFMNSNIPTYNRFKKSQVKCT